MTTPTSRARAVLAGDGMGRRIVLAALLAVSCALPAQAAKRERQEGLTRRDAEEAQAAEEAVKQFQFGTKFYEQGFLKQAEGALRQALAMQPEYPEAHYMLGLVYLELNDHAQAISHAEAALRQNIFFTEAHNLMGLAHAKMGRYEEALVDFRRVLSDASYPTPEVAWFNIGRVAWERQECGEALPSFKKAIEINAQFGRVYNLLGDCQETLGLLQEARESYEKALQITPGETAARYRLGHVCFQLKDLGCARQAFEHVRANAPGSEYAKPADDYLRQINFR